MEDGYYFEDSKESFSLASCEDWSRYVEDSEFSASFAQTVKLEVERVKEFVQGVLIDDSIDKVLMSRIEYLFRIINKLVGEELGAEIFDCSMTVSLFELVRNASDRLQAANRARNDETGVESLCQNDSMEAELLSCSAPAENSVLAESRTHWLDMFLTSSAISLIRLLQRVPARRADLDISLAETVALGQADQWQMQYLAVVLVQSQLSFDILCDLENNYSEMSASTPSSSAKISSASVSSVSKASRLVSTVGSSRGSGIGTSKTRNRSTRPSTDVGAVADGNDDSNCNNSSSSKISNMKADKRELTATTIGKSSKVGSRKTVNAKLGSCASNSAITAAEAPIRVSNSAGTGAAQMLSGDESDNAASDSIADRTNTRTGTGTGSARQRRTSVTGRAAGLPLPIPMRRAQSSVGARGTSSGKQNNSGRALRRVDEICKSGYLRTVVWLLLHSKELVRCAAAEVLKIILKTSSEGNLSTTSTETAPAGSTSSASSSDVWACCVEQGLVAHLEYVRQGIPVHRRSNNSGSRSDRPLIFPEYTIRSLAHEFLSQIAREVISQQAVYSRLTGALVHSGSSKLRLNILSSFLYLCGRLGALGRLLCARIESSANREASVRGNPRSGITPAGVASSSPSSSSRVSTAGSSVNGGNSSAAASAVGGVTVEALTGEISRKTLFYDMLTALMRDHVELRGVLRVLVHFLETAHLMGHLAIELGSGGGGAGHEISTQTETVGADKSKTSAVPDRMEPMVLIKDVSRTTKMVCPSLKAIGQHSSVLHQLLQNAMEHQIGTALHSLHSSADGADGVDMEGKIQALLKNMDDSQFIVLRGSYNIWQEVFSHMTDASYLLTTSVQRMSILGIIEALHITTQYGMKNLGIKYSEALIQRVTTDNFIQVFQSSVGVYFPTKPGPKEVIDMEAAPITLHLYQVLQCLRFLDGNLERIVTIWKPKDNAIIVDCLHRVLQGILLAQQELD